MKMSQPPILCIIIRFESFSDFEFSGVLGWKVPLCIYHLPRVTTGTAPYAHTRGVFAEFFLPSDAHLTCGVRGVGPSDARKSNTKLVL